MASSSQASSSNALKQRHLNLGSSIISTAAKDGLGWRRNLVAGNILPADQN
jgi:hypothetical protein